MQRVHFVVRLLVYNNLLRLVLISYSFMHAVSYLEKKHTCSIISNIYLFILLSKGPGIVDIPTTRRVYETVKSGLERIGVNYPIGEYFRV
jgi:hypothetical protein